MKENSANLRRQYVGRQTMITNQKLITMGLGGRGGEVDIPSKEIGAAVGLQGVPLARHIPERREPGRSPPTYSASAPRAPWLDSPAPRRATS